MIEKTWWNNTTIKVSKQFLENTRNVINWLWSLSYSNLASKMFAITDRNIYVPVVTLLTQDNVKLLDELKWGFKTTTNWDKYQSKATIETRSQYLDYLIDPNFQEENRLFVSSLENNTHQTSYKLHFLQTVEITVLNFIIFYSLK